jgi:subtilisin family serine protease
MLLCAGAAGQGPLPSDDPYFVEQVSFHGNVPGTGLLLRSYQIDREPVKMAAGIHLDVQKAWALTTGSRAVVVAILDDGFFYDHEDLARNIWRNPGETGLDDRGLRRETNGVDDDGNGYKDDVMGWDFAFNDPDPDHYIFDGRDRNRIQPYPHAVSAMGIIGAVGNNGIGVAGINWDVSMMLLKIGSQGELRGEPGLGRVERAARAIRYASDNGARVINWSGFVRPREADVVEPLRTAIEYAGSKGVLVVIGAGNEGWDLDDDAHGRFPPQFDLDNMLRVAQLGMDGELYRYEVGEGRFAGSNYGENRVEIAAIGENFTTGLRNGESTYRTGNGTSDAGPVVAGVAALILAVRPDLEAKQLKKVIMDSATPLESLRGVISCGGVVNAHNAVRSALAFSRDGR